MALNDNAVLTAAKGFVFTAAPDTPAPLPADVTGFDPAVGITSSADGGTTPINWKTVGHTARGELPVFGYEGGETETKGTWQNATFRQVVTEVASDYVTFNVHQFDDNALGLYYGTDGGTTTGVFEVQEAPTKTVEKALLVIIQDGDVNIAFHAGKAGIKREDSIELAVDEFAFMPLRATFLKSTTSNLPLFSWISEQTGINAAA